MTAQIHSIEENLPHVCHEVICVLCGHRYIAVAPIDVPLKQYECGGCGKSGGIIWTGQVYNREDEPDFSGGIR